MNPETCSWGGLPAGWWGDKRSSLEKLRGLAEAYSPGLCIGRYGEGGKMYACASDLQWLLDEYDRLNALVGETA